MAEEKKPEAENKAPGKAAAPRRTRSTASKAKTAVKKETSNETKAAAAGTAAKTTETSKKTAIKKETVKEEIRGTVFHKEEKIMTQEALGMVETRGLTAAIEDVYKRQASVRAAGAFSVPGKAMSSRQSRYIMSRCAVF